jgi:hypothetical protein
MGERVGPMNWLATVLGIETGHLFLGSSRICLTLLGQHERLLGMACHERIHVVCINFLLQEVYRFESP